MTILSNAEAVHVITIPKRMKHMYCEQTGGA
jgi:hypothetical protein